MSLQGNASNSNHTLTVKKARDNSKEDMLIEGVSKEGLLEELQKAQAAANQLHFSLSYYDNFKPECCSIALHPENHLKNTFEEWALPFDHNHVSSMAGRYINASPMQFSNRSYIATQGPVKETSAEFWHMVLLEDARFIISLTNTYEVIDGVHYKKFDQFWPSDAKTALFGNILVTHVNTTLVKEWEGRQEKLRLRTFSVTDSSKTMTVYHYHMENWPDDGVVHKESLLCLIHEVEERYVDSPIVVHCAAGIGRTGTFIAAHSLFKDMQNMLNTKDQNKSSLDVILRIQEMRKLRYGAVVASLPQYALVVDTLALALEKANE